MGRHILCISLIGKFNCFRHRPTRPIAGVANHVGQRKLLPQQKLRNKPQHASVTEHSAHEATRPVHPAQVPLTSNSMSLKRKPRGSFGGGGG